MREVEAVQITEVVKELSLQANYSLRDDVLVALKRATGEEESPLGREILGQLVENARIAAANQVPLCQDTGQVTVFLEMGNLVHVRGDIEAAVNEGVKRAWQEGSFRPSIVAEPIFERTNTGDNTPVSIYVSFTAGQKLKVTVMLKGGGSENASRLVMLRPTESLETIKRLTVEVVREGGGSACPPVVVGLGIGGGFDRAPLLSKKALLRPLDKPNLDERLAILEEEILEELNKLGFGPAALGGRITALGVSIESAPTHIGCLPVAVNVSCHALRQAEKVI